MAQPAESQPAAAPETQPAELPATSTQPAETPATQSADLEQPPRRKDILHLDYLDGDVEFGTQYDWQRTKFPVQNTYAALRQAKPDRQDLADRRDPWPAASGDIVDPQWFTYNMNLRLGMNQDIAHETSPGDHLGYHENGWLAEYNINFGLLQGKPLHFDVYTAREDGRLNRLFMPSLWHEAWRTGVHHLLRE